MSSSNNMHKDHLKKCRVCFRVLDRDVETVTIDRSLQKLFQQFTGVELKYCGDYSKKICTMCNFEIKRCQKFRITITIRQNMLYKLYPSVDEAVEVKQEPELVINSSIKQEAVTTPILLNKLIDRTQPAKSFKVIPTRQVKQPVASQETNLIILDSDDGEQIDYVTQVETVFLDTKPNTSEFLIMKEEDVKHEKPEAIQSVFLEPTTSDFNLKSQHMMQPVRKFQPCKRILPIKVKRLSQTTFNINDANEILTMEPKLLEKFFKRWRKYPTVSANENEILNINNLIMHSIHFLHVSPNSSPSITAISAALNAFHIRKFS